MEYGSSMVTKKNEDENLPRTLVTSKKEASTMVSNAIESPKKRLE